MEHKITWMRYLVIGISLPTIILLASCRKEYTVQVDFIYINETPYGVSYNYIALDNSDTINLFKLEAETQKIIVVGGDGGADKNPNIETCCEGYLDDLQGHGFAILVIFDDLKCITYEEGEGPTTTNILNGYEKRVVAERHFEFTYRFTEEQFNDAELCN